MIAASCQCQEERNASKGRDGTSYSKSSFRTGHLNEKSPQIDEEQRFLCVGNPGEGRSPGHLCPYRGIARGGMPPIRIEAERDVSRLLAKRLCHGR